MKKPEKNNKKPLRKEASKAVLPAFPMRINRYLAYKGHTTRTGGDKLISAGKVHINGRKAVLGDKVQETDKVEVDQKHISAIQKTFIYLAYNKPVGVVSTNPQEDEKSIMDDPTLSKLPVTVFPIGRIDKDSHGLILLTNDGRITDRLLNPVYRHEKEYIVEVDKKYTPAFLRHMQDGVAIKEFGEYKTAPAIVKQIDETTFNIILTEGKNRQIRRMTEKLGYTVVDLCRIRVQNITLGNLKVKNWREVTGDEKKKFLETIGL